MVVAGDVDSLIPAYTGQSAAHTVVSGLDVTHKRGLTARSHLRLTRAKEQKSRNIHVWQLKEDGSS